MRASLSWLFVGSSLVAATTAWLAVGCGDSGGSVFSPTAPDAAVADAAPTQPFLPNGAGTYSDFSKDAIIDGDAPANSAELFAGAEVGAAGGPCLVEPEIGSMFPRNWLRPRFRWVSAGVLTAIDGGVVGREDAGTSGQLFELRLHADNEVNDLVVYTTNPSFTLPKGEWDALRTHAAGVPITLTIRGGTLTGGALVNASAGSTGPLAIAPVDAPGTIVYWTTISGGPAETPDTYNPVLKGFRVGDESVTDVVAPSQMAATSAGAVKCVGCHTSTPDGLYAVPSTRPNPSGGGVTQIGFASVDGGAAAPPYVSAIAKTLLGKSEQEAPTFSPGHFAAGDRVAVSMLRNQPASGGYDIVWTDLEATSSAENIGWGKFKRTGDPGFAALANVSHDGEKIVYVSTPNEDTSGTIVTKGALYTIPWGMRAGGPATALTEANAPGAKQFYPAFSPDDQLIAFDRSPEGTKSYADPMAEIWVTPSAGGAPQRLMANDPPQCTGAKSPGTYNSWPKWAPDVGQDGTKKYYFIVFSSARNHGTARFGARLYITPVVVDGPTITTYAALYLWNQPETEDNHSPAWDTLKIPTGGVK